MVGLVVLVGHDHHRRDCRAPDRIQDAYSRGGRTSDRPPAGLVRLEGLVEHGLHRRDDRFAGRASMFRNPRITSRSSQSRSPRRNC